MQFLVWSFDFFFRGGPSPHWIPQSPALITHSITARYTQHAPRFPRKRKKWALARCITATMDHGPHCQTPHFHAKKPDFLLLFSFSAGKMSAARLCSHNSCCTWLALSLRWRLEFHPNKVKGGEEGMPNSPSKSDWKCKVDWIPVSLGDSRSILEFFFLPFFRSGVCRGKCDKCDFSKVSRCRN